MKMMFTQGQQKWYQDVKHVNFIYKTHRYFEIWQKNTQDTMMDFLNDSSGFHLADNLRALRKRMSWSQEELALKMGLNRGNIASYESGTAEPRICNLVKFAQLFGISIFDLTHNDLKEEKAFLTAQRRQQNGNGGPLFPTIKQYAQEAADFDKAIKGLECIFRMRIRQNDEVNEEATFYKKQFEQLHAVAEHLLKSHVELIATVKSKCTESQKGKDYHS